MRRPSRLTAGLFLATVFSVTFEKIHWELGVTVNLADVLTVLFLLAFAGERLAGSDLRLPRTGVIVLVFSAALLVVYLVGFFNLDTEQALAQFGKGIVKFAVHFAFLAAAVAYLARRSERFYWRTLAWFCAGLAVNSVYGVLQLAAAQTGRDLDEALLSPLTGGAAPINIYGAVEGEDVYRPNALTGDPNHLAIMLVIPLLALTYGRRLVSAALLVPLAGVAALLAFVVSRRSDFFETVLRSRIDTRDASTSVHLDVYGFIPDVLGSHPLFGLGLNNFSVYYEFVTGKTNWGPHSFYVALLVETGLVGTLLFGAFLVYVFRRLARGRQVGRALAAIRSPAARRIRPLAWGLTAALVGTIAANAFYLTMQFYYFYAFVALALALPIVFGRRLATV